MTMKYRVWIEQDENGVFVAEVPSLPGCISQGKTRADALRNIREAVTLYLESLEEHGTPFLPRSPKRSSKFSRCPDYPSSPAAKWPACLGRSAMQSIVRKGAT